MTMRERIKEMINDNEGASVSAIVDFTGFKKGSVISILSSMKNKGFAERRGNLWFSVKSAK